MKRFSKLTLLGMASVLALAACADDQPGFEKGARNGISSQADALAAKSNLVRRGGSADAGRAFYGRNMNGVSNQFAVDNGKPFPPRFERADALEIVTPEPASIKQIELLLQELTGLNVVVRTRYEAGDEALDIPINSKIRINHKGSLSELVRTISSRFDLAWDFNGETITFDRMDTRSYDIPLPSSNGTISTSLSGVQVGGNSVSSTKNITLDPWKEILEALESVVADPGKVTVSPNTGRVTIFAPVSDQEEAAKIVQNFENLYSKRIGLEIATFFVDVEKSAEFSADFGVGVSSGDFTGATGQGTSSLLAGNVLSSAIQGGIGVISGNDGVTAFNMSNISGNQAVADYQSSNTVAQNGVVAPVVLTNSKTYVSKITTAGTDSGSQVETDLVDSGISIYSLPRLMRNGKIHLSIWVTQSELNSLETFDTGAGFVQLPDADQRAVEYTLIMEPGETLVMGGYEQERASSKKSRGIGGLGSLGIGAGKSGDTKRTRMVLMVRPTIIGN
jgi:hypothetical protein